MLNFVKKLRDEAGVKPQDCMILASLSAKWRAPFRQREERLKVFSSPSSNTAEMRETIRLLYVGQESTNTHKHTLEH